jgi:hypothetical protein
MAIYTRVKYVLALNFFREQLQNRHRNVNHCLEELCNLYTWWESLSMVEKRMPINKEHLVLTTEVI